jgi:hypothetical protein
LEIVQRMQNFIETRSKLTSLFDCDWDSHCMMRVTIAAYLSSLSHVVMMNEIDALTKTIRE